MNDMTTNYNDEIKKFAEEKVKAIGQRGILDVRNRKAEIASGLIDSAYFVGIREPIEETMMNMLVMFVIQHYPYFNGKKIKLAFELAVAGKINCNSEHFGNFSGVYVSKILSAYEALEARYIVEYKREQEKLELASKNDETVDLVAVAKEWAPIITEYAEFLAKNDMDYEALWPWDSVKFIQGKWLHMYLEHTGIIKQPEFDHSAGRHAPVKDIRPELAAWCLEQYNHVEVEEITMEQRMGFLYKTAQICSKIENDKNPQVNVDQQFKNDYPYGFDSPPMGGFKDY